MTAKRWFLIVGVPIVIIIAFVAWREFKTSPTESVSITVDTLRKNINSEFPVSTSTDIDWTTFSFINASEISSTTSSEIVLRYNGKDAAYVWNTGFTVPKGDQLAFAFKWIHPGDGAYLDVSFQRQLLFSSLGTGDENQNDKLLTTGLISITSSSEEQVGQLLFWLHPGGTQPAEVVITDARLVSLPPPEPHSSMLVVNGTILYLLSPNDTEEDYYYYKNDKSVYIQSYGSTTAVVGADPASFTVDIPNNSQLEYAMDGHSVYFLGKKLFTLSNPEKQFTILNPGFSLDCGWAPYAEVILDDGQKEIFYGNKLISGADASSFDVLDAGFSKDKNYVYLGVERTTFNPKSFDKIQAEATCPIG